MEDLLICTNCKEGYNKETVDFRCQLCGEPLDVKEIKEGTIKEGNPLKQSILDRYQDFYPYLSKANTLSLGEGFTPLVSSQSLAKEYGVSGLYFKDESSNPTWSFKDRGTITGIIRAKDLGYFKIGTVSTGNMATSVAAYGARAGLETYILVKKDMAEEKLKPISIYNPHLIRVDGDYGKLYYESLKLGHENQIYFINSDSPFRVEGYKTIAFEIAEQLDFMPPDYLIVPTSAGGNFRGIEKGFRELKNVGIIDRLPKMVAVQATGCCPIYTAYKAGKEKISRFERPKTIAQAIENPYPPSGNQVLRLIKDGRGLALSVTDEEIIRAQARLASIGIFGQVASATSLAAVEKLRENNILKATDKVVAIITASGLKYTAALDKHNLKIETCKMEDLGQYIKSR